MRRGSPTSAPQAIEAALSVLGRGGVIGVYPEGTRSPDGLLHRGRLGPVRLAAASGAPIVPVGLVETVEAGLGLLVVGVVARPQPLDQAQHVGVAPYSGRGAPEVSQGRFASRSADWLST